MARRKLIIEVAVDADGLKRGLRQAEGSLNGFAGKVQAKHGPRGLLGGTLLGGVGKAGVIGAGVAASTALAVKGLSSVIAKAKEAEVAQANLDQAFTTTGQTAPKKLKRAEDAIQRVSKAAAFDDEEVAESFASLLRTTGSLEKATRGAALAANIARARRISLAAATKVVEKAENGQLRGLKAVGVQIDKNTTSQEAIERAQRKFAGSAEAYGRTAAGAQEKYRVALENVQERIGAKLLPLQTKLALKAVEFLDWADKNWPRFANAIGRAYRAAKPFIDQTIGILKGLANELAGLVKIVDGIVHGDWAKAWEGFKQFAVDGVAGVVKAIASLPLKIAKSLGRAAFEQVERIFVGAVNRLIDLVNRAIGAYNSIPLVPNIGKIGHVGASVKPQPPSRSVVSPRPEEGTRGPAGSQGINLAIAIDGTPVEHTVTMRQNKRRRANPPKRRG